MLCAIAHCSHDMAALKSKNRFATECFFVSQRPCLLTSTSSMFEVADFQSPFPHLVGTNTVPTEIEANIISKSVHAVDCDIRRLDAELTRLTHLRARMQQHQDDNRPLLSVIRRIPAEIIIDIVEMVLARHHPVLYWITIKLETLAFMQVCARWSDIIKNTPKLWTSFIFGSRETALLKPTLSDIWMARSANLPITILVEDFYEVALQAQSVADFIISHLHRCRSLTIYLSSKFLKHLWSDKAHVGAMPQLAHLDIEGYCDWNRIFALLPQCPKLQTFKVQLNWPQRPSPPTNSPILQIPHLHHFNIHLGVWSVKIFNHLELPVLQTFAVVVEDTLGEWSFEPIISLLLRSKCPLRTIFLNMHESNVAPMDLDITLIFEMAPLLQHATFAGKFTSALDEATLVRLTRPRSHIQGIAPWQDIAPSLQHLTLLLLMTSSESHYSALLNMVESRASTSSTHLVALDAVEISHAEDLLSEDVQDGMYNRWRNLEKAGLDISVEDSEYGRNLLSDVD